MDEVFDAVLPRRRRRAHRPRPLPRREVRRRLDASTWRGASTSGNGRGRDRRPQRSRRTRPSLSAQSAGGVAGDGRRRVVAAISRVASWAERRGRRLGPPASAWRDRPHADAHAARRRRSTTPARRDYARALAEVASAACSVGEPTIGAVTRASAIAAAQLRAGAACCGRSSPTSRPPAPTSPSATDASTRRRNGRDRRRQPRLTYHHPDPSRSCSPSSTAGRTRGGQAEVHHQAPLLRVASCARRGAAQPRHHPPPRVRRQPRHRQDHRGPAGRRRSTTPLGVLSTGQLVECDRSELVAGYVGQTALKTAEVIDAGDRRRAVHRRGLHARRATTSAPRPIDTLVKEMEDHRDDLVVIVAGYPRPMRTFIETNPGLESRFRLTLQFDDYADDELVEIFVEHGDQDRFRAHRRLHRRGAIGCSPSRCATRASATPDSCATSSKRP